MTQDRNYRGRFEGEHWDTVAEDPTQGYGRRKEVERQTATKAIAAFISAFVALLATFGIAVPWMTESSIDQISWLAAFLISLVGSGAVSAVTYQVPNKPKPPEAGRLG